MPLQAQILGATTLDHTTGSLHPDLVADLFERSLGGPGGLPGHKLPFVGHHRTSLAQQKSVRIKTSSSAEPPAEEDASGPRAEDSPIKPEPEPSILVPTLVVLGTVLFNLWTLRAERLPVQYLNDNGVHISMVAWAAEQFASGEFPLDGWFPHLGLGLPLFHHYQSLPHLITGLFSLVLGAQQTFGWSLYLLMAFWPACIYWSARLLGRNRWESSFSALLSPLLVSVPGFGYEYGSYTWQGLGVWSQLWGMWMLPLAWGLTWRALSIGKAYLPAALTVALAIACHLLTGYLALLSIGAMTLIKPSQLLKRVGRAAIVSIGSSLLASWVILPLIIDMSWSNRTRYAGNLGASHGAPTVLDWLFTGGLFDGARFPVITILAGLGTGLCIWRWKTDENGRALLALGVLSLTLYFGRPTLGSLVNLLPGGQDIIYRRFIMGVHVAGIILAGVGAAIIARAFRDLLREGWESLRPFALQMASVALLVTILWPAFAERSAYAAQSRQWIQEQREADQGDGADFVALIERAKRRGPGRIYAGTIWGTSWGDNYRLGRVPAYASLLHHDTDSVGFSIRTVSLSSDVEVLFDESNPAHYELFNIRYLILPMERDPGVPATMLALRGRHRLWEVATPGYLEVIDTIPPPIVADRGSLGRAVEGFMASTLPEKKLFPTIAFDGRETLPATAIPGSILGGSAGSVEAEQVSLAEGKAEATIYANRKAVVLLKATFHPRWKTYVDGTEAGAQMIAPSYVGVGVPKGRHSVLFVYRPFPHYWSLLLAVLGLFVMASMGRWRAWLIRLKLKVKGVKQ